ncbi:MAG: ABC transporter ATP-binding protein [Roseiarcus sp.]
MALSDVSLAVGRGEFVVVTGPSGSGKSTLLSCLTGLEDPDGGVVTVDGRRLTRRTERERAAIRAAAFGILGQAGNLFAHLTVRDNIALQLALARQQPSEQRVEDALAEVGIADLIDARPAQLSGGEAARAGLAVALAKHPPILVADEPTAEVDRDTEGRILDILDARRRKGGATLIATHSESLAARADRVIRLWDGRVRLA